MKNDQLIKEYLKKLRWGSSIHKNYKDIEAKSKGEVEKYIKQIDKADMIICDEWGYIPFEKEGSQLLFQIISTCYGKKSIILTTNLEFSKWDGIFYDEKLTSAIIDRFVHHSHLLVYLGPSYRLTN